MNRIMVFSVSFYNWFIAFYVSQSEDYNLALPSLSPGTLDSGLMIIFGDMLCHSPGICLETKRFKITYYLRVYMLFDPFTKRFGLSGKEEHNHMLFAFSVPENVPGAFMQFI